MSTASRVPDQRRSTAPRKARRRGENSLETPESRYGALKIALTKTATGQLAPPNQPASAIAINGARPPVIEAPISRPSGIPLNLNWAGNISEKKAL